ncbi:hypothetical protein HHI36_019819 [Cryptolaemus montrouzieri]|uniref:Uncharacterized protein n=1 Tax=Cryptolaemus montrouzieri TaxID=559131 RepID=A0ABD2N8W6_9CUCU
MAAGECSPDRELLAVELDKLVKKSLIDIISTKTVPKEVTNDVLKTYLKISFSSSNNENVCADASSEPIEAYDMQILCLNESENPIKNSNEGSIRDGSTTKREENASNQSQINTEAKRQVLRDSSQLDKVNKNKQTVDSSKEDIMNINCAGISIPAKVPKSNNYTRNYDAKPNIKYAEVAAKTKKRNPIFMIGNKTNTEDKLKPVPKMRYIHVYTLQPETKNEDVSNYARAESFYESKVLDVGFSDHIGQMVRVRVASGRERSIMSDKRRPLTQVGFNKMHYILESLAWNFVSDQRKSVDEVFDYFQQVFLNTYLDSFPRLGVLADGATIESTGMRVSLKKWDLIFSFQILFIRGREATG